MVRKDVFVVIVLLFSILILVQGVHAVGPPPPVAAFSGMPTSGSAPLTVAFTDISTVNPTGWAWFFGDETYTDAWTQVNAGARLTARAAHSSVAMPDGSIVLMGGEVSRGGAYSGLTNDVWMSTDNGASWTQVNTGAGWTPRSEHSSVAMPDGSIILMEIGRASCRERVSENV